MRTIERTTICIVLSIAPFVGIGCMFNKGGPPRLTRKEPKIFAVQRDKPLSAQADANKPISPSDQSAKTEESTTNAEIASDDKTTVPLTMADRKTSSPKTDVPLTKSENEPAVAKASIEPKRELKKRESKKTEIPSNASVVPSPKNVILAQSSSVPLTQHSDPSETNPASSQIELANHNESTDSDAEEIQFEIPKVVSPPTLNPEAPQGAWDAPDADEIEESLESTTSAKADEWTSPDGFDAKAEKIEERDFQQVCLVKFREERVFTPGLPEFTVEYRAQHYRFSSADAAEKFQSEPERFAPTAGGLDVVAFANNQEVIQGSLDFAVWYKQRLFLFRNHENIATFQRQPEKFEAIQ